MGVDVCLPRSALISRDAYAARNVLFCTACTHKQVTVWVGGLGQPINAKSTGPPLMLSQQVAYVVKRTGNGRGTVKTVPARFKVRIRVG